jgi:histidinol-phosphate aminotransferase
MHMRQAKMAGTAVSTIPRESDFSISLDAALTAIERIAPDVVFVCTPNNPTGTVTPIGDIRSIADATPGLVLVDEAYHEFSGTTFVPYLEQHPNVVVVRTLSKAFRLAGVRLGYGIAAPELLEEMGRVRMPYGLSSFTQLAATIVLRHREKVLELVSTIAAERDRVAKTLAGLDGVDVFDGAANFVFFRHEEADRLVSELAKAGVVIRDFSFLAGCENCLRVTAGTPEENDAFLAVAASLA